MATPERLFEPRVQFLRGIVGRLDARPELPPLHPDKEWNEDITATLTQLGAGDMFAGNHLQAPEYAEAVRAGLLLWNDALDESHSISQGIENETGSYWHAIMHRRECDFSNSKYWFEKVGAHPVFQSMEPLCRDLLGRISGAGNNGPAKGLAESGWDPFTFVDWCALESHEETPLVTVAETLQLYEIQLLLTYSESEALGT